MATILRPWQRVNQLKQFVNSLVYLHKLAHFFAIRRPVIGLVITSFVSRKSLAVPTSVLEWRRFIIGLREFMSQLLSFDEYCDLLAPVGALNSPAELHGMLCGQLSGGARPGLAKWQAMALEFLDLVDLDAELISAQLRQAIAEMYTGTLQALEDEAMGFSLILPDEDTDMGQRLQALAQWCHGFLTGFGSSGLSGDQSFSPESAEALRDFAAIVQIGTDEEDNEQSEADLFEVSEYVRIAAINLFLEFSPPSQNEQAKPGPGGMIH